MRRKKEAKTFDPEDRFLTYWDAKGILRVIWWDGKRWDVRVVAKRKLRKAPVSDVYNMGGQ